MTIETLQSEMIAAMKNKDTVRKMVLSGIIGAIKKAAIDKNCRDNITESLVDEVLLKYKKMTQEMIDTCPADRVDTLKEYKQQMAIVAEFAPSLITDEEEITNLIKDYADGAKISLCKENRGTIMKILSRNLKGKADMSIVNKVVGGLLQ
jgi:uncharacterized protein YqeY